MTSNNKRTIGLSGAISIGIGGMVGGGIFAVLGEAVSLAHKRGQVNFFIAHFSIYLSLVYYTINLTPISLFY